MSWITGRDYTSVGPVSQGDLSVLEDDVAGLVSTTGQHTNRLNALDAGQVVQDTNIGTNNARDDTQDTRLDNIEEGYSVHFFNLVGRVDGHDGELANLDFSTGLTAGNVLTFDAGSSKFRGAPAAGGATALSALTDTAISAPATNQLLVWNGSAWANRIGRLLELQEVAVNGVSLADNQVLTYSNALAKWTNLAVPRSTTQLSDVALTPPTAGQVLQWNSGTSRYTPTTLATGSSTIAGATDWQTVAPLTGGDVVQWNSGAARFQNTPRLTTAEGNIGVIQGTLGQLAPINSLNPSLNNSVTTSLRYATGSTTTAGTNNVAVTDLTAPFAYRDNSVAFDIPWTALSAVTLTRGVFYTGGGVLSWKGAGGSVTGVNTISSQGRINFSFSTAFTLNAANSLLLAVATGNGQYSPNRYQWWGSNSPSFASESSMTPTGTLLADSGVIGTQWTGERTLTPSSTGPWQYLALLILSLNNGSDNLTFQYAGARSAPGGLTGKSVASGELAITRDTNATGAVIVAKTTAATNTAAESMRWDLGRLGLWELYNRLLPTVTDIGVLRVGGWRIQAGADLRELQLYNDGWQQSTNTTPTTVNRGVALRTSLQGGKNYLIIRPLGATNTGMCMAINLDSTASTDAAVAFMPNVASGTSNIVAALRQNGDLYLAGTTTTGQAGLMGNLNPFT